MIITDIHDKLKDIYSVKLKEVKRIDVNALPDREMPVKPFSGIIQKKKKIGLIAEIKKASPSRGLIRTDFNLQQIIRDYQSISADAISVLTDQQFFKGHNDYLKTVKQLVKCPVLRKDFVIDEKQIYESYSIGADIILLIVAILPLSDLKNLLSVASQLKLEVITEAHTKEEVKLALDAGAKIIGINNRDLNTFKVDIYNCIRLAEEIPDNVIKIAESGINTHADIKLIEDAGYNAVLIGEAFMTNNNIPAIYKSLFENDTN